MNLTDIAAWKGLITDLLGLCISGLVAWFSTLRGPKVLGVFSDLKFEKLGILPETTMRISGVVSPTFVLKNIGAKPAIIEGIRLRFCFNRKSFFAYPIPAKSFEENLSKPYEIKKRIFTGHILSSNEEWKNERLFEIEGKKFPEIKNFQGNVFIELKLIRKKHWIVIKTNNTSLVFSPEELKATPVRPCSFSSNVFRCLISKDFKKCCGRDC